MTDKELFEKTEKTFNLKKENVLIENIFDKGNFKKVLNEIRTSAAGSAASGGGLLGQIGSAVKYLSPTQAKIRKAEARKAEIEAQMAQQKLMKGQNMYNAGRTADKQYSKSSSPSNQQPNQQQPEQDFKINDTVLVRTKKNPNVLGRVTNLLPNQKDRIQVTVKGAPPYAYNIQNVKKYDRVENEESFEQIVKRYR